MTQLEASEAVIGRWIASWPSLSGDVPFAVDNVVVPEASVQAALSIRSLPSEQSTIAPRRARKYRRRGLIEVRLTGPLNEGRKRLDQLAGSVRSIFEGVRFGSAAGEEGITTYATDVVEERRGPDAAQLWILKCTTPFEFFEVHRAAA